MRTLNLNVNEVRLLCKVEKAGHGFFSSVSNFLEEFKNKTEEEVLPELTIEKDEYEDVVEMIKEYLCDDSLSDDDLPSEKEEAELIDLLNKLEA